MEVRAVLGSGEVHLDVVKVFALAEIVVIGGGEKAGTVAPHDRLQVSAMDVERQRLESVHPSLLAFTEIIQILKVERRERSEENNRSRGREIKR